MSGQPFNDSDFEGQVDRLVREDRFREARRCNFPTEACPDASHSGQQSPHTVCPLCGREADISRSALSPDRRGFLQGCIARIWRTVRDLVLTCFGRKQYADGTSIKKGAA